MRRTRGPRLSTQVQRHSQKKPSTRAKYDGSIGTVISTGSTLLDLAISGGRTRGGGMPAGILVEVFGPASCGKTILLCEIAGAVQRQGGQVHFHDPEGRLNKRFARLFGLNIKKMTYDMPNTVPEVFAPIRDWHPTPTNKVHGIFADSLAALSTEMELEDKDQYGVRRAKEFSEECRKTCRTLAQKRFLMVCSNQVRQNLNAGPYGMRYKSPGGEAIGFYSSLRLRCSSPKKIKVKKKIAGKEHQKIVGVETKVEVFKSSVWEPFHTAPLTIIFEYGIDAVRDNLRFLKAVSKGARYAVGGRKLPISLNDAATMVEEERMEKVLREAVIDLWEEKEAAFHQGRKKRRDDG